MYTDASCISCGVDQLYGFEDEDDEASDEEIMYAVSRAMWEQSSTGVDGTRTRRLAAAMYMFSDTVESGKGHAFGQFLQAHPEFGPCVGLQSVNPNSRNLIAAYLWTPNVGALKKNAAWARGKKAALDAKREREKLGW